MFNQIFVNMPIENLKKSVEFFTELGFTFNAQFTDESSTCMIDLSTRTNSIILATWAVFEPG